MNRNDLLATFPTKRIEPIDGMPVTAAVWAEAHDHHRLHHRFHNALAHGPGILFGLDVIASDPPDSSVYIMPGLAIDPGGAVIAVTEPVAFDIGASRGYFYLLLTHGESAPRPGAGSEIYYVHSEFGVEAHTTPAGGVELARVWRAGREDPITDARDPEHPTHGEIDRRFRRELTAAPPQSAHLAVCAVGGDAPPSHLRGVDALARTLRQTKGLWLWADREVPIDHELERYTLVYLVGRDSFVFSLDELGTLGAYLQQGGTVLIEICRRDGETPPADAALRDALASLGVDLAPIEAGHRLLTEPHLFAAPPPGYVRQSRLLVGEGVIFSEFDYGCLWQGEREGGPAPREAIRAAHEWGHNLVAFACRRRNRGTT